MSTGQMVGEVNAASLISLAQAEATAASASAAAASVSEANSAASEANAVGSATVAIASAAAASVSADAAQTVSGIYADTTAGLAATASGDYFYVPAGISQPDVLILYLDNAGTAAEQGRMPASLAVQAITAAVTPAATDTNSDLLVFADRDGAPFARFDSGAQLTLAGDSRTVQNAMATARNAADANDDVLQIVDLNASPILRADKNAALWLPGQVESVQSAMERARYGVAAAKWTALPAAFTPFSRAYEGQERYIWGGMLPGLRPNQNRWIGYPFTWPTTATFVTPAAVRRRTASYVAPAATETGTLEALTVNLPGGYAGVYQFRDLSVMYDRKKAKWFACLNSIGTFASGFLTDRFAVFESTDGLTWDFTSYCIPGQVSAGSAKVWSPEWFVDDSGSVYVIVGLNTGADTNSYWAVAPTDDTMTAWTVVGKLTGSTFPTNVGGGIAMNDPYLFRRDGVYYCVWSAMSNATSVAAYQLGLSYSTSLLGPYNQGHSFTDNTGQVIKGEGQSVVELPYGSARRFRLFWFNVAGQTYGGRASAVMPSPCVDSNDLVTFGNIVTHGTDASYFQHNTAIIGA